MELFVFCKQLPTIGNPRMPFKMKGKVLVAEDNMVTQQIMKAMLEDKCEQVATASSAHEVLDYLTKESFDILFLDYHLDKDANDVIKEIKKLTQNKSLDIYIVSAERENDVMNKLGHTVKGFLAKPIDPTLIEDIFQHYNFSSSNRSGESTNQTLLNSILGDNQERIAAVKQFFVAEIPVALMGIKQSLTDEDYPAIKQLVHRIRPAYAYLGRDDLFEVMRKWEDDLDNQQNIDSYLPIFENVKKETVEIIKGIDAEPISNKKGPQIIKITTNINGKLILIIDDNQVIISAFTAYLENHQMKIIHAKNGLTGVAMAIGKKPDLILMDINLPEISGLEAIQEIRQAGVSTPIYAMSTSSEYEQKSINAGANGFLTKPIDGEYLIRLISNAIPA